MRIAFVFVVLCSLAACTFNFKSVKGSGNRVKEERSIAGFESVHAAGSMDIVIKQSNDYRLTVEADDNLMQYIETYKDGDALKLKITDGINIKSLDGIKITVESPVCKKVQLAGSGNITTEGTITNPGKIEIALAGSGDINMDVTCPEVALSVAGAGNTTLKGMTRKLDIGVAGTGDVNAAQLKSEGAEISIGGSSNVSVYASRSLAVSVAGRGDVVYYGNPEITQSIAGSGKITKGQ